MLVVIGWILILKILVFHSFYSDIIVSFAVAEQLIAQHSAIKMLHSRVKLILEYIKAVESGRLIHSPRKILISTKYSNILSTKTYGYVLIFLKSGPGAC